MEGAQTFGQWCRARRRALDLTQAELGRRVGCAAVTVRKIEADERRPSVQMAERLFDELGGDRADRHRFVAAARAFRSPDVDVSLPPPGPAVPAPINEFVGRDQQLRELRAVLAATGGAARLVTVIGPPGVGKTRLAVEVARRAGDDDAAVATGFIALAGDADASRLVTSIAAAYGVEASDPADVRATLRARLDQGPTLLVLDNLEQMPDAGPPLVALLEACPSLTCLVTSRVPLGVYGEHVFPLDPLPVPGADDDAGSIASSPSVELLMQRARAVGRRASLGADLDGVVALCRRLDGLPLAIELAARRLRDLQPAAVVAQLDEGGAARLGAAPADRGGRHRTIDDAIAWSHDLLGDDARSVLAHASVFPRGAPVDALRQVCALVTDDRFDDALDELERHSLVARDPSSPDRVLLLEVIRAFAADRLGARGLHGAARHRHALWFLDHIRRPAWAAAPADGSRVRLARADADLTAALRWTLTEGGDPAIGIALIEAAGLAWYLAGRGDEVAGWIERALVHDPGPTEAVALHSMHAMIRWGAGDLVASLASAAAALDELAVADDDPRARLWGIEARGIQAMGCIVRGDLDGAEALLSMNRTLSAGLDEATTAAALTELRTARIALLRNDAAAATAAATRSRELYASVDDAWGVANATGSLAEAALAVGDAEEAIDLALDAVTGMVEAGAESYAVFRLVTVATASVAAGRADDAALVAGAVDAWLDRSDLALFPLAVGPFEQQAEAARRELGDDAYESLRQRGRDLPCDPDALRHRFGSSTRTSATDTSATARSSLQVPIRSGSVSVGDTHARPSRRLLDATTHEEEPP